MQEEDLYDNDMKSEENTELSSRELAMLMNDLFLEHKSQESISTEEPTNNEEPTNDDTEIFGISKSLKKNILKFCFEQNSSSYTHNDGSWFPQRSLMTEYEQKLDFLEQSRLPNRVIFDNLPSIYNDRLTILERRRKIANLAEELMNSGVDTDNKELENCYFKIAAMSEHSDIFESLLRYGMNPDFKDDAFGTILNRAITAKVAEER